MVIFWDSWLVISLLKFSINCHRLSSQTLTTPRRYVTITAELYKGAENIRHMEHVVNWITGTNYNSLTMPCPGKLALLFCYVVTCVCWVAAFPFYATHKLPSSNVPVNCGRNQTVFMVTGLGHRLCGEDYFITKKDNMTQFGKVSLFCSIWKTTFYWNISPNIRCYIYKRATNCISYKLHTTSSSLWCHFNSILHFFFHLHAVDYNNSNILKISVRINHTKQ